jgi:hypothetical protein
MNDGWGELFRSWGEGIGEKFLDLRLLFSACLSGFPDDFDGCFQGPVVQWIE